MAWMRLKFDETKLTTVQNWLLSVLNDPNVQKGVNEIIADFCYPYVPYKTGALRDNVAIGPKEIQYRQPYARYQYYGVVYGPNYFRGIDAAGNKIFRSPAGVKKYPTTRMLSYQNGKTSFWFEIMLAQKSAELDKEITDYLEAECQRRGL